MFVGIHSGRSLDVARLSDASRPESFMDRRFPPLIPSRFSSLIALFHSPGYSALHETGVWSDAMDRVNLSIVAKVTVVTVFHSTVLPE
jgi:hypothetical protein